MNVIHFKGNFMLYLTMKEKCKQAKEKKKSVSEQAREKRGRRKVKDFEMFEQLISWSQATKPVTHKKENV